MNVLDIGTKAPDFELTNQNREMVRLSSYKGSKLLLYFFPKAGTPGCTQQACSVNLAISSLTKANMRAIGISPDTPEKQKEFADKYGLNFPLLSDPDNHIAKAYGVWGTKHKESGDYEGIIRSSFVIDENGFIIQENYNIEPRETVTRAEQLLKMY